MIHSLAGELCLDVYILSLSVSSLDDNNLKSLIGHLPKSCIVLIEDIDAAFTRGMKRDILDLEGRLAAEHAGSPAGGGDRDAGAKEKAAREMLSNHGVTLSGLLNALDGIAAQEGRILFATTNDYSALDPALLRPGRLDLHVEFTLASRYQATELFKRFYTGGDDDAAASCEEDATEQKSEKHSGYDSRSSRTSSVSESTSATLASIPEGVSRAYVGMTRPTRAIQLSPTKAAALANQFAEVIPPKTFSMATLQGYLMAYKVRPYDAIAEAPAWVEKKLKEKAIQSVTKEGGVASE